MHLGWRLVDRGLGEEKENIWVQDPEFNSLITTVSNCKECGNSLNFKDLVSIMLMEYDGYTMDLSNNLQDTRPTFYEDRLEMLTNKVESILAKVCVSDEEPNLTQWSEIKGDSGLKKALAKNALNFFLGKESCDCNMIKSFIGRYLVSENALHDSETLLNNDNVVLLDEYFG